MPSLQTLLLLLLLTPLTLAHPCANASSPSVTCSNSTEVPATRNYFYVGGTYIPGDATSRNGTLLNGQMYVEHLVPVGGASQALPLVFWHGAAQTGTNWLNTPDGRRGWASYFLARGWEVYLIDQPQRGRSMWELSNGEPQYFNVETIEEQFTASQDFKLWPQAYLHTQWPGSGRKGDPVFDAFYATQVQDQGNATISEQNNRHAGAALLDRIGEAILVSHSQSGPYIWGIADMRPDNVKGILALEPAGPPFRNVIAPANTTNRPYGLTIMPLTYDPPLASAAELTTQTFPPAAANLSSCIRQTEPARSLPNLAKIPTMMLTTQASYHAPYDYCTVAYLKQAGVDVHNVTLPNVGIDGNGHLMFLEKNSLDIAAFVEPWLEGLAA